jgi:hypothetical protein
METPNFAKLDTSAVTDPSAPPSQDTAAVPVSAGGVIVPTPATPQAGLTAQPSASPTNAAPAPRPGSFSARFGDALRKLGTSGSGMSFGEMAVASGAHAMSMPPAAAQPTQPAQSTQPTQPTQPAQSDSLVPSNATWQQAQTNADQSQPTTDFGKGQPSNAQKVIGTLGANLGDLAAATEGGTAGGALAGAARVAAAQTSRQRQEREDSIKMATANAQMLHEQQLVHRTSEDAVEKSAAEGARGAEIMMTAPNSEILAKDKTSDELTQLINSKGIDPSRDGVFLTGRKLIGNDSNGLPMYRSTYTVVKPGDRIAPTAEEIDFLNEYTHSNYAKPEDGKPGQTFSSQDWYMINQRAMTNLATKQRTEDAMSAIGAKKHEIQLKENDYKFLNSSEFQAAINAVPHTGSADPYLEIKAYTNLERMVAANPDAFKGKLPENWQEQAQHAIGGGGPDAAKNFKALMDDFSKQAQKNGDFLGSAIQDPSKIQNSPEAVIAAADQTIGSSQDPAVVAQAKRAKGMAESVIELKRQDKINTDVGIQNAKDKAVRIDNNPNGLTGDAFIKTLPAGRANLVRGIAEGRIPVNANAFERSTGGKPNQLADDVFSAYPDFNATLGAEWPKAWSNYLISGNDHKKSQAYNVALLHMQNLYNNSTVEGLFNPATKAYQDRVMDLNNFARELGNALSTGVLTQSEHDEIVKSLKGDWGSWTPGQARERITEAARLLAGKIQTQQDNFEQVRPSASMNVPSLLLPASKRSLDYVLSQGGKNVPGAPSGQPTAYKIGDTFQQGGHTYTVTSVDQSGKVTGAK